MTRLKQVLTAAAALVATGTAIGVALNQAGQTEGMTATEWCDAINKVSDAQTKRHFFVAYQPGNPIPKQAGGRLVGDCAGGECTIVPDAAPSCAYNYGYDCGPPVDGWRVCDVYAHPYIANGWRLAADEHEHIQWFSTMADVVTACLGHTTGAKCLQLLRADERCWLLTGDRVCRYGRLISTGEACPYGDVVRRFPCVTNLGAGSEWRLSEETFTAEELDTL